MRRTLADFNNEVNYRLANRSDVSPTQRDIWIDDAYRWCCKAFKHHELEATSFIYVGLGTHWAKTIPADCWWIDVVKDDHTGRVLDVSDIDIVQDQKVFPSN